MKKNEAEKLVNETLTHPYEEQRFRGLVVNLFNDIEQLTEQASSGQYIFEAFRDKIISFKRIAKFKDPENLELDVLAVKVKNKRMLDNARTTQRNFVSRYLTKKSRDAALVAFYSDDSEDWRFSLVRMDYAYDEQKKKLVKELSPSRRYSFLVGKNEKSYTARKQLVPILESEFETTIQSIENAFNIEKVTKEFFEQYKELFLRLTEELEKVRKQNQQIDNHLHLLGIQTSDFCKKLLGQIVFLYFLQKKGWLGVDKDKKWGDGDKNFLRSLFDKCKDKGEKYFDGYLEPLFYEALATDDRDGDYYSRFDCRIPFLNGGLFEPTNGYSWQQYDFNIPNDLFSNSYKTKSGDTGDGILDVFDRYNFTVREDESLEKEVAVDPEMLGKVFENLLEVKDRKSKGAFYTPREIVHYMCQESLINYLDTKLNIQSRPIENKKQTNLLPELVETDLLTEYEEIYNPIVPKEDIHYFIHHGDSARENDSTASIKNKNEDYKGDYQFQIPESVRKYAKEIDKALADVKICDPAIGSGAFPVGIMHEIVRARLTLLEANLVKQTKKANAYEYKRQAIQQSIYGVDIEESAIEIAKLRLWLSLVVDETDMEEIKPLPNLKYKIVKGNSLLGIDKGDLFKHAQLKRLEELKDLYFDETSKGNKKKYEREISEIIKSFAKDGQFDFEIFFSEVFRNNGGFDIVIGNPPYVKVQAMGESEVKFYKTKYVSAKGKFDIYLLFVEKSLELIGKDGYACLIHPHKFLTTDYGKTFKAYIDSKKALNLAITFGVEQVFETATTYTGIFGYKLNSNQIKFDKPRSKKLTNFSLPEYCYKTDGSHWSLINSNLETSRILEKIKTKNTLGLISEGIYQGIVSVGDDIFIFDLKENYPNGTSLCYSKALKDNFLIESYLLKPLLKGEHIKRYKNPESNLVIFYPHIELNSKTVPIEEDALENDYPLAYEYISKFKEELVVKKVKYKTNPKYWYSLHRSRQISIFNSPKIITPQLQNYPNFTIDNSGYWYPDAGGYSIILKNSLKEKQSLLLGILNSSLAWFFIKNTSNPYNNNYYYFKTDYLAPFPIPETNEVIDRQICLLVEKICDSDARLEKERLLMEGKVNQLVYELYKLTPEEIAIVEEDIK